jgi:drug/metabolite transporter, DME family
MTVRRASWLIVAAAACFGTTGTAQALAAAAGIDASAASMGAARIVFGGALLAGLMIVPGLRSRAAGARPRGSTPADRGLGRDGSHPRSRSRPRLSSLLLLLVGAVGVAAYQPTFFTGTAQNGVAVGTLVALGSAPVITGLLEWGTTRRAPGIRWAAATAVAALGVAALSGLFSGGGGAVTLPGVAASLAAAAAYAVYTVSSKLLLDRGWTPTRAMGATFGLAAVLSVPTLVTTDPGWITLPAGLATTAWLAIVTTALAYTLFARGLLTLPASRVSTLTLVEPVTATVLGVLVLREAFTGATVVGITLLVVGLAILAGRRRLTGSAPR